MNRPAPSYQTATASLDNELELSVNKQHTCTWLRYKAVQVPTCFWQHYWRNCECVGQGRYCYWSACHCTVQDDYWNHQAVNVHFVTINKLVAFFSHFGYPLTSFISQLLLHSLISFESVTIELFRHCTVDFRDSYPVIACNNLRL